MELAVGGHAELARRILGVRCRVGDAATDNAEGLPGCSEQGAASPSP